jgi:hypothetical protein
MNELSAMEFSSLAIIAIVVMVGIVESNDLATHKARRSCGKASFTDVTRLGLNGVFFAVLFGALFFGSRYQKMGPAVINIGTFRRRATSMFSNTIKSPGKSIEMAENSAALANDDPNTADSQPPTLRERAKGKSAIVDAGVSIENVPPDVSSSQAGPSDISKSKGRSLHPSATSPTHPNTSDVYDLSASAIETHDRSDSERGKATLVSSLNSVEMPLAASFAKTTEDEEVHENEASYDKPADLEEGAVWVIQQDDQGYDYYWNIKTNETTYDKPETFKPPLETATPNAFAEHDTSNPQTKSSGSNFIFI